MGCELRDRQAAKRGSDALLAALHRYYINRGRTGVDPNVDADRFGVS